MVLAGTALAVGVSGSIVLTAVPASAHAWTTGDITARAAIPGNGQGSIEFEPQSLEAQGGFPATGPVDGQIASAGQVRGPLMDEQSADRWIKNEIEPGPITVGWRTLAGTIGSPGDHETDYIDYYITKVGWDPNDKLERSDFELLEHKEYDGETVMTIGEHTITIPDTHQGYHVVLGVWEINNTSAAFYNVMDVNISGEAPPVDTEAPSTPTGLQALNVTSSSVLLGWDAATDNVGVTGYEILRDGVKIATTSGTTYTDGAVAAESDYIYEVRAFDAAKNTSGHSVPLAVTTPQLPGGPDTEAPSTPKNLHAMGATATSVALMWSASTDNVGVAEYKVWDAASGRYVATTDGTHVTITGLTPGTLHTFMVQAFDAAGNASAASNMLNIYTLSDDAEPVAPAWNPRGAYTKGDKVSHNGFTYEAVQTHQGNGDPNWIDALSLWKKI